jgi:LAS superfamily LD-carboxypeptidase LdcB
MKNFLKIEINPIVASLIITAVFAGIFIPYGIFEYNKTIKGLSAEFSEKDVELSKKVASLEQDNEAMKSRTELIQRIILEQQQAAISADNKFGQITGSIDELKKLSQTDPELLRQYSKVYFLNEHYVPISLTAIDPKYLYENSKLLSIHTSVYPHLKALLDSASLAGLTLRIDSAYRTFGQQATLKSSYKFTYGAGTANSFSAEQGYSEHQLGTTVDFTTNVKSGGLTGFDKKPEYEWLKNNAYIYGFVLSYPEDNQYYEFEPWHWRYVGVALANKLHSDAAYFYDWDQRMINTYLPQIFD